MFPIEIQCGLTNLYMIAATLNTRFFLNPPQRRRSQTSNYDHAGQISFKALEQGFSASVRIFSSSSLFLFFKIHGWHGIVLGGRKGILVQFGGIVAG